jgi:PPOX class probable F420-dependent enzyme
MLGSLASRRYISLTTFRRDGTPVSVPVWVVSDDGKRLLVWTGAGTWKVKRIRRNPQVLVAASTFRGREKGERLDGTARILDGFDVRPLIRGKYGWQMRMLERFSRGSSGGDVTIEIV